MVTMMKLKMIIDGDKYDGIAVVVYKNDDDDYNDDDIYDDYDNSEVTGCYCSCCWL